MPPPKKPGKQKASQNPHKNNSNKVADLDVAYYKANTKFVSKDSDNIITEMAIARQLSIAPNPRETGKSGYPHKFLNEFGKGQIPQLVSQSASSSTTSLYEIPGRADDTDYKFDSKKPKDDPGNLRIITNQNGTFKGIVAHDGEDGNPNRGFMHWVEKKEGKKC